MGGGAAVKFNDLSIQNALAQLRNGIGRPADAPTQGQEQGEALGLDGGEKLCDIYLHGKARVGVGHRLEIVKVGFAGVGVHIEIGVVHDNTS